MATNPHISHAMAERLLMAGMRKLQGFTRSACPLHKMPATLPKYYIFNVSNQSYSTPMTAMHDMNGSVPPLLTVPACPEGAEVSESLVISGMYAQEVLKIDTAEWNLYNGWEIANEVLQKGSGKHPDLNLELRGVFISETNPPSKEDIATAKARLSKTYQGLLSEADMIMAQGQSKGPQGNVISEDHRRAAKYLGQTREFAKPPQQMKECPSCGQSINAGVAIHIACGAILDVDKALKFRNITWDKAIELGLKNPEDRPGFKPEGKTKN